MKHFFYILILISFVGCNSVEKPEKPKDLIPKEEMSDILYDLHILNAAKGVNRKVLELNGIMPADYVYKKHGVDSLQFAQSNTYYAYDMKVYNQIVEKLTARLEKDKELFEKLTKEDEEAERAERDARDTSKRNFRKVKDSIIPSDLKTTD